MCIYLSYENIQNGYHWLSHMQVIQRPMFYICSTNYICSFHFYSTSSKQFDEASLPRTAAVGLCTLVQTKPTSLHPTPERNNKCSTCSSPLFHAVAQEAHHADICKTACSASVTVARTGPGRPGEANGKTNRPKSQDKPILFRKNYSDFSIFHGRVI